MNFCPYCSASHFKLVMCGEDIFFCRECNRFFMFQELSLKCPRCESVRVRKSDFPSPSGELVFQCLSCKKNTSASEFLMYNKIK